MITNLELLRSVQDKFSAYPGIQDILKQVKKDKEAQKERREVYYDDERLAKLAQGSKGLDGSNGISDVNGVSDGIHP